MKLVNDTLNVRKTQINRDSRLIRGVILEKENQSATFVLFCWFFVVAVFFFTEVFLINLQNKIVSFDEKANKV